jgi:hypothetical protein
VEIKKTRFPSFSKNLESQVTFKMVDTPIWW